MAEPIVNKDPVSTQHSELGNVDEKNGSRASDGDATAAAAAIKTDQDRDAEATGGVKVGGGWMYRPITLGPLALPWYASPQTQTFLVAIVCFLCPGMFNAINGIGGGGQLDATVSDNSNVAVYATFSVVGFFAGTIVNRLGVRITLSVGGFGYFVYVMSYLVYNHTANAGFNIFAGALLGCCAGILWAAQGAIMMSYPPEGSKGKYIAWFWMIFNLGAVMGSLIPLGQNIDNQSAGTVNDGTYIGFMVLTLLGCVVSWCLVDAGKVRRADGSHVIVMKHPTWQTEIFGLWEVLLTDTYIIMLFPMFLASNWFYTYQFNGFNGARFDVRTRALNSVLYWMMQIVGAYVFGYFLDIKSLKRPTKAKIAMIGLFVLTMAIWGGGLAFQNYTRADVAAKTFVPIDWSTNGYVGPMFLYMFYGFFDAAWQITTYWLMGTLTNNARKAAIFTGFYKGIQSAGAAVMFGLDGRKIPFLNEFISTWVLLVAGLLFAAPVILWKIRETTSLEEDLKFTDATVEDVLPFGVEEHDRTAVAT